MENTSNCVEAKKNQEGTPLTPDDVLKTVKKITVNASVPPATEKPESETRPSAQSGRCSRELFP